MRLGSPTADLRDSGDFCDVSDIQHSGRTHSGDALYRRCVAPRRFCILCIVSPISHHKISTFATWPLNLLQGEAIQMIPIREPHDIRTIRSARRVPSSECGRRVTAAGSDGGSHNEDHRSLRPSGARGPRCSRGGLREADRNGLHGRAVRGDRRGSDLPDGCGRCRDPCRSLPPVSALRRGRCGAHGGCNGRHDGCDPRPPHQPPRQRHPDDGVALLPRLGAGPHGPPGGDQEGRRLGYLTEFSFITKYILAAGGESPRFAVCLALWGSPRYIADHLTRGPWLYAVRCSGRTLGRGSQVRGGTTGEDICRFLTIRCASFWKLACTSAIRPTAGTRRCRSTSLAFVTTSTSLISPKRCR